MNLQTRMTLFCQMISNADRLEFQSTSRWLIRIKHRTSTAERRIGRMSDEATGMGRCSAPSAAASTRPGPRGASRIRTAS